VISGQTLQLFNTKLSGLSGAVVSLAASPSLLASSSLDRYARIHSVFPPPQPGQQQEHKGEVLEKIYLKSIPTTIVWDQNQVIESKGPSATNDDDNLWETMERIDDGDDVERTTRKVRTVI
jgi:ribosome biogenesis protein NSA1